MSSNIRVQRICEYCSNEFTARTTRTKYCSHKCANRAYKAQKRTEKINKSNIETTEVKLQSIEVLKAKDFLNINEVCKLIGWCHKSVG